MSGRYLIDGQQGAGIEGYGFRITHRHCAERATEFIASPIFFPWNSETEYLSVRRLDIADCGDHNDPTTRSQDGVYAVNPVSHIAVQESYIHDAWRNLLFLQDAVDVLIENVRFARAGLHHQANTLALRNTRNVVIRRNTLKEIAIPSWMPRTSTPPRGAHGAWRGLESPLRDRRLGGQASRDQW